MNRKHITNQTINIIRVQRLLFLLQNYFIYVSFISNFKELSSYRTLWNIITKLLLTHIISFNYSHMILLLHVLIKYELFCLFIFLILLIPMISFLSIIVYTKKSQYHVKDLLRIVN